GDIQLFRNPLRFIHNNTGGSFNYLVGAMKAGAGIAVQAYAESTLADDLLRPVATVALVGATAEAERPAGFVSGFRNFADDYRDGLVPGQQAVPGNSSRIDQLQTTLDGIGLVPGIGEVADAANGFISLARGDYINAGLSFISMIPGGGDFIGKGGKILWAADKGGDF